MFDDCEAQTQLEALVRQKVEAGGYRTADEIIEEALNLLDERNRRQRLRAALVEGEKGEGNPSPTS